MIWVDKKLSICINRWHKGSTWNLHETEDFSCQKGVKNKVQLWINYKQEIVHKIHLTVDRENSTF